MRQTTLCCWCLFICVSGDGLADTPGEKLKRLCGPACVTFCARWLGTDAETVAVAQLAEAAAAGTSLRGLEEAAATLGLEAKSYILKLRHLRSVGASTPGIARVDGDHFVVVWMPEREEDTVMVVDPPHTVEKVSLAAFGQRWNGAILVVSRPGEQPRWPLVSAPWVVACCAVLVVGLAAVRRHLPFSRRGRGGEPLP